MLIHQSVGTTQDNNTLLNNRVNITNAISGQFFKYSFKMLLLSYAPLLLITTVLCTLILQKGSLESKINHAFDPHDSTYCQQYCYST